MASYQTVISNDTLTHKALPGSPETLCGKLVVDLVPAFEAPNSDSNSNANAGDDPDLAADLSCDICATLAGGGNFLKENIAKITEAGRYCPACKDGFDASGNLCEQCGGSGWLSEDGDEDYDDYTDLSGIDPEDLRGTKVAADKLCENGCGRSIAGLSFNVGNEQWCTTCASTPPASAPSMDLEHVSPSAEEQRKVAWKEVQADGDEAQSAWRRTKGDLTRAEKTQDPDTMLQAVQRARDTFEQHGYPDWWSKADRLEQDAHFIRQRQSKVATNWTRDGQAIEDGEVVTIDKAQASRTPFLDYTRVAVSEKRECPDCHEGVWVSKVAGCDSCGEIKCQNCMENIGASTFFGMCKTCASADSDLDYEINYQDAVPDLDRYTSYLLMEDDEADTDPLFLPSDPN